MTIPLLVLALCALPASAQDCLPGFCASDISNAGQCGLDLPVCEPGVMYSEGDPCFGGGCDGLPNCRDPIVPDHRSEEDSPLLRLQGHVQQNTEQLLRRRRWVGFLLRLCISVL